MSATLTALQARLGHTFHRPELLEVALTHPSVVNEDPSVADSNQRLEFLGDAVLQLILTEELFKLYPTDREGALSSKRFSLVKGEYLSAMAREIELAACIRLGPSEVATGGAERDSTLEDAFEAVMAAVYLDAGYDVAKAVVLRLYGDIPRRLAQVQPANNPKGRLQELVQPEHGNNALRYEVTATTGQAHAREFEVVLHFKNRPIATGRGTSKQRAEEAAARAALEAWPPAGTQ
ncbi:MAG: ribonuclease III [Cephaloticoccus sp.]